MKEEKKMILKKVVDGIWQDSKGGLYFAAGRCGVGGKGKDFSPLSLLSIEKIGKKR